MKHINLSEVRRAYAKGINITDFLKTKFRSSSNTSEIIEIAYDLQAGSYIDYWQKNTEQANLYAAELATIPDQHTPEGASILDVGTGEMTTLTTILNHMNVIPSSIFALDLSWSRIIKGIQFFESNLTKQSIEMNAFVSDMSAIPITSNSLDVITSSHALEPNAAKLDKILSELFRIAKQKLVLFEPSYELNSQVGKSRMRRLGYIENLPAIVNNLGGRIIETTPIKNVSNPLNPTVCYIIETNNNHSQGSITKPQFCIPGTNQSLYYDNGFLASAEAGIVFPILDNIPILKLEKAILATAR